MPILQRLTLLNRRTLALPASAALTQFVVDPLDPSTYQQHLSGHSVAMCTLGVGQPSKVSREELVKVDKTAVLDFAAACKQSGVTHFELLAAVAADAASSNHYLRTKGELREALIALEFARLSIFQPAMILTTTNRYDWTQALMLSVWPKLSPLLRGNWRKYRGIRVETLGAAMAANLTTPGSGVEILHWQDFTTLTRQPT